MEVVELRCAGGTTLATTRKTLSRVPFSKLLTEGSKATEESQPHLLGLLLDALRRDDMRLVVPEGFDQWGPLTSEARRLGLSRLAEAAAPSIVTIACHAALSAGRLNPEVTFRKILRIVVSGKVAVCRTIFTDTLNECRDSGGNDFEEDRYTARFFLKHNNLEKAFDALAGAGFVLTQSNTFSPSFAHSHISDETQFLHHSQYVFQRRPQNAAA